MRDARYARRGRPRDVAARTSRTPPAALHPLRGEPRGRGFDGGRRRFAGRHDGERHDGVRLRLPLHWLHGTSLRQAAGADRGGVLACAARAQPFGGRRRPRGDALQSARVPALRFVLLRRSADGLLRRSRELSAARRHAHQAPSEESLFLFGKPFQGKPRRERSPLSPDRELGRQHRPPLPHHLAPRFRRDGEPLHAGDLGHGRHPRRRGCRRLRRRRGRLLPATEGAPRQPDG